VWTASISTTNSEPEQRFTRSTKKTFVYEFREDEGLSQQVSVGSLGRADVGVVLRASSRPHLTMWIYERRW
jgi:hypothetical protein